MKASNMYQQFVTEISIYLMTAIDTCTRPISSECLYLYRTSSIRESYIAIFGYYIISPQRDDVYMQHAN